MAKNESCFRQPTSEKQVVPLPTQRLRSAIDPVSALYANCAPARKGTLSGQRLQSKIRPMQKRPSSRLLVLNSEQHLLLFKFEHKRGPLAGQSFWATPGGGVDEGETFEDAARRELYEEVGMRISEIGTQVAQRTAVFTTPTGEVVEADERYFLVRVATGTAVSDDHWTELEREVMANHRWWSPAEIQSATEQIWPEGISKMLIDAGAWESVS